MRNPALLYLSIAAIILPTVSSAQGFHRNLPIGHAMVGSCHASSTDGGLFAYFPQQSGRPLVRFDGMGDLLWTKSLPQGSSMIAHPDGGLLLLRYEGISEQPSGEEYRSSLLQHMNADGGMVMNQRLSIEDWGDIGPFDELEAVGWLPNGQFYVLSKGATFSFDRLIKFDALGGILWCQATDNFGYDNSLLRVLADGGLLLVQLETSPSGIGRVTRLDPDGEVVWSRWLQTNAPSLVMSGSSVLVDDDGSLLMAFTATSYNASGPIPWVVLGKMDVDANMLWSYAYRRDPGASMSTFQPDFDFHSPARILPNGNLYFGTNTGFEFTPQGLFVREKLCTTPTLAEGFNDITHRFTTVPTADGWLQYGIRRWTDPVFGNFVQLPLFGRTLLDLDSTCFWNCTDRTDITAVPPPPEIFSPTVSLGFGVFHSFISETLPLESWEDTTLDAIEDACDLPEIVEFNTSVNELDVVDRLMLFPNPVMAGQTIQLDTEGPLELEVLDARGCVVASQQYNMQPAMLGTEGWDAGLYLFRATRPNGQVLGSGRLVVQ